MYTIHYTSSQPCRVSDSSPPIYIYWISIRCTSLTLSRSFLLINKTNISRSRNQHHLFALFTCDNWEGRKKESYYRKNRSRIKTSLFLNEISAQNSSFHYSLYFLICFIAWLNFEDRWLNVTVELERIDIVFSTYWINYC